MRLPKALRKNVMRQFLVFCYKKEIPTGFTRATWAFIILQKGCPYRTKVIQSL